MELSSSNSVALIVGVTGMVGFSLVETLNKPTTAGSPWTVYGLARRSLPAHFPANKLARFIQLDVLDRTAALEALAPLACHVTHLFWVTFAERDTDAATSSANSAMLVNVLDALTASAGPRLRHVALQTGTRHYYWGLLLKDQAQLNSHVPFKESAPRNTCELFYYKLEDVLLSYSSRLALTWTVHRSSLVLGASDRSIYNVLLTLAAYALICRQEKIPFLFPGTTYTWRHFCDATDAELVAEQQIWAGTTAGAWGQAFNCTNADVFTWRSFWKVLCELFHVDFVEKCGLDEGQADWACRMMGKGAVWAHIVKDNGLLETKLEEVTCFEAVYIIVNFEFQHVSCMNKSRELGFCKGVDTLKSVKKWLFRLGEMNIIPKVWGDEYNP